MSSFSQPGDVLGTLRRVPERKSGSEKCMASRREYRHSINLSDRRWRPGLSVMARATSNFEDSGTFQASWFRHALKQRLDVSASVAELNQRCHPCFGDDPQGKAGNELVKLLDRLDLRNEAKCETSGYRSAC
jgi:hypothetical protein